MIYRLMACAGALLLAAACNYPESATAVKGQDIYNAKLAHWDSLNIHDYGFVFQRPDGSGTQRVDVEVRSDAVTSVTDRASGTPLSLDAANDWPTVDSLFTWAELAVENSYYAGPGQNYGFVTYDSTYGYPTYIPATIPGLAGRVADSLVVR